MLINLAYIGNSMAKSDSFFIRAHVDTNGSSYAPTEIDLGSFVNLGVSKSTLLRIHNVAISMADPDDPGTQAWVGLDANAEVMVSMQLTTQSQTDIVHASDKSLVSSGKVYIANTSATANNTTLISESFDVLPQMFKNGYLVGVDSLFWAAEANIAISGDVRCSIVMECTLEAATQANSVALALSQQ